MKDVNQNSLATDTSPPMIGSLPMRRRRYTCPECGSKGRSNNRDRTEPKARCPRCGTWLVLQIQSRDGKYTDANEPVNKVEYYI